MAFVSSGKTRSLSSEPLAVVNRTVNEQKRSSARYLVALQCSFSCICLFLEDPRIAQLFSSSSSFSRFSWGIFNPRACFWMVFNAAFSDLMDFSLSLIFCCIREMAEAVSGPVGVKFSFRYR